MANKYGLPSTIVEIENHVGHWKIGTGASSLVDEVRESRKIASKVHELLKQTKVPSTYFHDDTSTTKAQNLKKLVDHHNQDVNGLIMSYHLNASTGVKEDGIGTEVIYTNDKWKPLAEDLSAAIAKAGGYKNRGAKKRTDLYVLNNTKEPAILLETFFVNSKKDVELYNKNFDSICKAIATTLAGALGKTLTTPIPSTPQKEVRYRLYTGTYKTQAAAQSALNLIKQKFSWTCYLDTVSGLYRVKTGTFNSETAAHNAAKKIKDTKIASIVHVQSE